MKLLICDDDISTLDALQSVVDCQQLDIDRILRAYNGEEAQEIIVQEHPEMILCDIDMPRVNGIEVLRFLRGSGIEAEFIFATAYESFDYAREAVRYGAINYITKPFDFDEVSAAIAAMAAEVKRKKSSETKSSGGAPADIPLSDILRRTRDGILGTDKKRINQFLKRNGIQFDAESKWKIIIAIGDTADALKNGQKKEEVSYKAGHLMETVLTDYNGAAYAITDIDERFAYITCFLPADSLSDQVLMQGCKQFTQLCAEKYLIKPVCLIGRKIPFYWIAEEIPALRTKIRKLRFQQDVIYTVNEPFEFRHLLPRLDMEGALRSIRRREREEFLHIVRTQLQAVIDTRVGDERMAVQLHRDLMQVFSTFLQSCQVSMQTLFENHALSSLEQNAECSAADLMAFAEGFYDGIMELTPEQANGIDVIAEAKDYIGRHFRENISREQIAETVFVAPNYLSRRFSAETGMNLREYVNMLRIEEAKQLLRSTEKTVSEIAGEVGYDNISYFSTVFKKFCGVSPLDWRLGEK